MPIAIADDPGDLRFLKRESSHFDFEETRCHTFLKIENHTPELVLVLSVLPRDAL